MLRSNGFECLDDSKNIVMSVEHVADTDRLKFSMKDGAGNAVEYILKKGTADLTIPTDFGAAGNADDGSYTAEGYYTGEAE